MDCVVERWKTKEEHTIQRKQKVPNLRATVQQRVAASRGGQSLQTNRRRSLKVSSTCGRFMAPALWTLARELRAHAIRQGSQSRSSMTGPGVQRIDLNMYQNIYDFHCTYLWEGTFNNELEPDSESKHCWMKTNGTLLHSLLQPDLRAQIPPWPDSEERAIKLPERLPPAAGCAGRSLYKNLTKLK